MNDYEKEMFKKRFCEEQQKNKAERDRIKKILSELDGKKGPYSEICNLCGTYTSIFAKDDEVQVTVEGFGLWKKFPVGSFSEKDAKDLFLFVYELELEQQT